MKNIILLISTFLGSVAAAAAHGQPEEILGYRPTSTGIVFQVRSGGCTHKSDFLAETRRDPHSGAIELVLLRVHPDLCHPFIPVGERFKFSYSELGLTSGEDFIVKNKNGIVQGWIWNDHAIGSDSTF